MFTVEPLGADEPGCGLCETTVFWGWALFTVPAMLTLKPALCSVLIAFERLSPTTPGTFAFAGPLITLTRTCEPFGSGVPAGGSVAVTWRTAWPAGSPW